MIKPLVFLIGHIISRLKNIKLNHKSLSKTYHIRFVLSVIFLSGRKSQCIECIKSDNNRKIICECGKEISFSNKAKHVCERILNEEKTESKITCDSIKQIECTTCNKIISKTNWSKHEKTLIHNERHSN